MGPPHSLAFGCPQRDETLLKGNWIFERGEMRRDDVTIRIEWLVDHYLRKVPNIHSGALGRFSIKIQRMDAIGRGHFLMERCREMDHLSSNLSRQILRGVIIDGAAATHRLTEPDPS
jgi:hypothetical protein